MPAATHVNKARKSQGPCYTCHRDIKVGDAYAWYKANRFSPRYAWHAECTAPRPSVLEANEKRSAATAAFENANDEVDAIRGKLDGYQVAPEVVGGEAEAWTPETAAESLLDDLGGVSQHCAEGVSEAAEMWRESATNIEDGFGQATSQSEEMSDRADEWEGIATDIETLRDELDEYDASLWSDAGENPWIGWTSWAESALDAFNDLLGDYEGSLS